MLVLVTGGTGYIGSHSVAALVNGGHRVRVLARDAGRVAPAVEPLGIAVDRVETMTGDITDPEAVARAVDGCDAVLHAASVYSFDSRDHAKMRRINVQGTEVVLRAARSVGADPIVHVSSVVALAPTGGATVTPSSPVGRRRETYAATKAEAETVARRHQSEGAPVVTTYPPGTLGPHGREATPFVQTLADSVRWLHQAGHLRGRLAGRAATAEPAATPP